MLWCPRELCRQTITLFGRKCNTVSATWCIYFTTKKKQSTKNTVETESSSRVYKQRPDCFRTAVIHRHAARPTGDKCTLSPYLLPQLVCFTLYHSLSTLCSCLIDPSLANKSKVKNVVRTRHTIRCVRLIHIFSYSYRSNPSLERALYANKYLRV